MIEYIIDKSPTVYLFALGIVMRWIGSFINQRYPRVAFFQFAFAAVVFAVFGLRRLVVDPPYDGLQLLSALIRAGSFSMIAFGITGGIATMILLSREWMKEQQLLESKRQYELERQLEASRKAERRAAMAANRPSTEELARQRLEANARDKEKREREETQRIRIKSERAERRTLRLQIELKTQAIPDNNRRKNVHDMIDAYLNDDAPLSEFKRRLQIVQDHINREAIEEKTGFQTLTEIETSFSRQFDEINSLDVNDVEKASLRAYLTKEKQAVIHNFLKKGA